MPEELKCISLPNKEQIKMMCEMFGCDFLLEDSEVEGWFWLTVKRLVV